MFSDLFFQGIKTATNFLHIRNKANALKNKKTIPLRNSFFVDTVNQLSFCKHQLFYFPGSIYCSG